MMQMQTQVDIDKRFWFCYGTEKYLLAEKAQAICNEYIKSELVQPDIITVSGPVPDIGIIADTVGTISMFGGVRLVYIPEIEISAMQDKEVKEFCELMGDMENAVVVAFCVLKEAKQIGTKKGKLFIETAKKTGMALEIKKPTVKEIEGFLIQEAEKTGAKLTQKQAELLIEITGEDIPLLINEVQKLAAADNYTIITADTIETLATRTLEANVFEILDAAFAKKPKVAFEKLKTILDAGESEIMINGALASSFIDMYRVKIGLASGRSYSQVHKDMEYTGSDWRLKKSAERATRYSIEKLQHAVEILSGLDKALKSSAVNSRILLENALAEIISL